MAKVTYAGPLRPVPTTVVLGADVVEVVDGVVDVGPEHAARLVGTGEWRKAGESPATIAEVLAEVGDDASRAAVALAAELDRGDKARPKLVEQLTAIANPTNPEA